MVAKWDQDKIHTKKGYLASQRNSLEKQITNKLKNWILKGEANTIDDRNLFDIDWLKEYISSIDAHKIIFNEKINNLDPIKKDIFSRYL